jgi:hypothetical protein
LIDADENVTLEWRHESPCLVRLAWWWSESDPSVVSRRTL